MLIKLHVSLCYNYLNKYYLQGVVVVVVVVFVVDGGVHQVIGFRVVVTAWIHHGNDVDGGLVVVEELHKEVVVGGSVVVVVVVGDDVEVNHGNHPLPPTVVDSALCGGCVTHEDCGVVVHHGLSVMEGGWVGRGG